MVLHYQVWGVGGPLVLLIHGAASNLQMWLPWVPTLVENGFRVAVVDLPGHGQSPGPCTLSHCIETVQEILVLLKPQVLIGYSLGGVVAIEVAQAYPLQALFLVCPAVRIPWLTKGFYDWLVGWPLDVLANSRDLLKPWVKSPMARLSLEESSTAIREVWLGLRDWQGSSTHLTMPVRVAGGYFDHIAPPLPLRKFTASLLQAELQLFRGRHRPMESDPQGFEHWLLLNLHVLALNQP